MYDSNDFLRPESPGGCARDARKRSPLTRVCVYIYICICLFIFIYNIIDNSHTNNDNNNDNNDNSNNNSNNNPPRGTGAARRAAEAPGPARDGAEGAETATILDTTGYC